MEDGFSKTTEEVINYFNVDPERGLTLDQVKRNQEKYGPNGKFNFFLLLFYCVISLILAYLCNCVNIVAENKYGSISSRQRKGDNNNI